MKKLILPIFLILGTIILLELVSAANPMILRTIREIKSVSPSDVANLGIGVYQISAQYNLGSYQQGQWMGFENKKCEDLKSGAVWIEFSWERPETNVVLIDGAGNERKIYLPASTPAGNSNYGEYYWIAEDGSSYYANSNHGHGWSDLTYEQALVQEHLARASPSPEQKNPANEEPLTCGVSGNTLTLRGQLIDQMTNTPISGTKLNSAYEFSPEEVITDENGNFEFTVNADYTGSWTFLDNCHGWSGNIGLQKDYQVWQNGQLEQTYKLALIKEKFDSQPDVQDVFGQSEINMGKIYAYPSASISIESDISASFDVIYKYKNSEGYNGPGQSGYTKEHFLSNALPLNYDVFIQFKDQSGVAYKSATYNVPNDAMCGIVSLRYFNGESQWSVLSKVEPTEDTGPIQIGVPETVKEGNPQVISNLCYGCLKETTCYPLGYRKSGEFCSENKEFIAQSEADSTCDNNFECTSNVCVSGKCVDEGFIQKLINWFKRLFGGK